VFPDEVRSLQAATGDDWRDVARPTPYGLSDGADGPTRETFEWALATDGCGDCTFYAEDGEEGRCTVHDDRPSICATYPFSVALGGTSQPMGEAVDEAGVLRAHECEGLGRDISRADAESMARALKKRVLRELEEAIAVGDRDAPTEPGPGGVVVHGSEGAKDRDGRPR
jgi:Fe-S-cluster containining protein